MSQISPPRSSRFRLLIFALLLLAFAGLMGRGQERALAEDPVVEITEAPDLRWGFKSSWRVYVGPPAVSGGAAVVPDPGASAHQVTWQFDSGSFDPQAGTTVLRYQGMVHWTKYYYPDSPQLGPPPAGYSGSLDVHLLDVTLVDPIVTISRERATISAEARSRPLDTWEMHDFGRVDVVGLGIDSLTPTVTAGVTTWQGVPAVANAASTAVFGGNYLPGIAVDQLSFSYTGPGGAPDLSESFDLPGSTGLTLAQNEVVTANANYELVWLDREHGIAHYRTREGDVGSWQWTYQAFDLAAMEKIGQSLTISEDLGFAHLVGPASGRVFMRTPAEADLRRWIRFDRDQGQYALGALASPIPVAVKSALAWDPVGERAFEVVRTVPAGVSATAYDEHKWQLITYAEQSDGSWAPQAYDLPSFPTGLNRFGYKRVGVAASDGSLIVLADRQISQPAGAVTPPTVVTGAYRVRTHEDGSAEVTPIAGVNRPNDSQALFDTALAGPDGQVSLLHAYRSATNLGFIQRLRVQAGGVEVDPAVDLSNFDGADWDVDREDGTVWIGGGSSQRIVAVRDGRIVANQYFPERHPRGGIVYAGADHTVFAQTSDGSPPSIGYVPPFGFGRFTRVGLSPTVTVEPTSQATVLGAADPAKAIVFSSQATGTPAPARQWQVKAPGSPRFVDLAGEVDETLTVQAQRGMDGTAYRAVYANAAGRIATAAAALGVDYAPRVAFDPLAAASVEGASASFEVLADGKPEPTLAWQRRVDGFWQGIDLNSGDFEVAGNTLTVKDTSVAMDGALFRAKLTNAVASTYSKAAKLSVAAKAPPPGADVELDHVSLDWTGNLEMQKSPPFGGSNYFSAGASDGKAADYSAVDGDVRIYQVAAAGTESPATYATRAAHLTSGGRQLVRLGDGEGTVKADGSAVISWEGAFSVNFYGGLVPFTFTDPKLTIGADGTGALQADMSGCASSQVNPDVCAPLTPVPDVTFATFSGVGVDLVYEVAIVPDYAGVTVEVPVGTAPQDRTSAGWGAWPQSFVDFHVQTGLSSYWYSSGGSFDPYKPPSPFLVDFTGEALPALPPTIPPKDAPRQSQTPPAANGPAPAATPAITPFRRALVDARRLVDLAVLICPGSSTCRVDTPRRVVVKIGGERYRVRVMAPESIPAGKTATVRARLPKKVVVALGRGATMVRLRIVMTSAAGPVWRTANVRIAAAG